VVKNKETTSFTYLLVQNLVQQASRGLSAIAELLVVERRAMCELLPAICGVGGDVFILQQDNTPAECAREAPRSSSLTRG